MNRSIVSHSAFDLDRFLGDLETFIAFKTVVCENPNEFRRANEWIRGFFDPELTELIEFNCHGMTSTIVKPRGSVRPNVLGDGHIEVVPGDDRLFRLREENGVLKGRGVADMKTQCLMMIWVLKRLVEEGHPNDYWLLFSEDEEIGSKHGVKIVADYLKKEGLMPPVVFAPDGGPDFAYVEKEKGIFSFEIEIRGRAAHASRPYLGDNAIERMNALYADLRSHFPNPEREDDWINSMSMTSIHAGQASNQIPDCCRAGFDLRLTESFTVAEVEETIRSVASKHRAEVRLHQADPATYYPKEAPVARRYLDILRRVSGKEPRILHSAGASNGRIYVAADPSVHVLMTSPKMGSAHSETECLEGASLAPYYELVYETAKLRFQ